METKTCNKCKKEKPISEFRHDKYSKDGYTTRCKYCIDHKYKNICQICNKEFFGSHKNQKYCSNKCKGISENNNVIFNCDYCGKSSKMCYAEYYKEGKKNHYCSKECKDKHHSELIKGENHPNWNGGNIICNCDYCGKQIEKCLSEYNKHEKHFCSYECLGKYKSINCIGENSYNWKGGRSVGYNYIQSFLRKNIRKNWNENSINVQNKKCLLTGLEYDCVHHLYGFSNILQETFYNLNIELKHNPKDYTLNELESLKNECIKLHKKYNLGVCIKTELHERFHMIYGFKNNTKEQFKEFIKRYFSGEFDSNLENKLKSTNSKTNYKEAIKIFDLL